MCGKCERFVDLGRRNFLKLTGSATALGIVSSGLSTAANADALTKAQRDKMTPTKS